MLAVSAVRRRDERDERADDQPVVKYHVRFEVECPADPELETVASVRSRMGLLNEAMRRAVRGATDFRATRADYERGVLELDVWTKRLVGIESARVSIKVERVGVGAR